LSFEELVDRHPASDPPSCSAPKTASLVVDESTMLICLKSHRLKSKVFIALLCQPCSTHYTTVRIKNCLTTTSVMEVAAMKNKGGTVYLIII